MAETGFIRSLYKPLQPTENSWGKGNFYYYEQPPCVALQPYIYCFWELKRTEPVETNYFYRLVTDGCIDLIIDCHAYHGMLLAGVTGHASQVPMAGSVSYFGIRFLPAGINYFVNFPLHLIHNQIVQADNLPVGSLALLADLVFEKKDFAERIRQSEFFLLKQLAKQNTTLHPALARALHHILDSGGDVAIEIKAAEWISPRQLRRLFNDDIGCPPKLFARITRFQKTLYTMQYGKPAERINAFYQYGYADQAHFIKEFKLLYGDTPGLLKK